MEALVSLGVACNILQLISCGLQVASVSKQIYEKGSTDRNDEVSQHAEQLRTITASLVDRLSVLGDHGRLTKDQKELQKLAISCSDLSAKLQHEIGRLGVSGHKRRWRSVPASVNTILHQKAIDNLEKRLQENRNMLQTKLLADIHIRQEAVSLQQSQQYSKMEQGLQELVAKVATGSTDLSDLVLNGNLDLTQRIQTEGRGVKDHVTLHMQSLEMQAARSLQREHLEQSLQYPEMNERLSSLTNAHAKTFDWLFNQDGTGTWSSFTNWLANNDEIYWISGKPGAGKSVLMKHLFGHSLTDKYLSYWAKAKPVFKIHFFIWKAGHQLQRRAKGLLSSMVRQLIQRSDDFAFQVVNRPDIGTKRDISDWSVRELEALVVLFTEMGIANLCIFIDGLDEADSTEGDVGMLKQIRWLYGLDRVKVCAASRPEPEFRLTLAQCPQLILQNLTKGDLQKFATDQLSEVGRQQFLDEDSPMAVPERLLELVLLKADGVFLWVRLAITNITRGLRRMDGWEELTKRLDQLPSELEDLYTDMWQRNREDFPHYQEEAGRYFQMVLDDSDRPVSSMEITVAYGKHAKVLMNDPGASISQAQILQECKRFEQRILNCSLGLLEIRHEPNYNNPFYSRFHDEVLNPAEDRAATGPYLYQDRIVRFIHRTAIEFLRGTLTGQKIMQSSSLVSTNRWKTRIDTLMISQFCDFPVINLLDLHTMYLDIADIRISDIERVNYVEMFDNMQRNPALTGRRDGHMDVCRNYVDSIVADKWGLLAFIGSVEGDITANPVLYALGWLGAVARAGVVPYFEQLLSRTPKQVLSQDFVSCLAMCSFYNYYSSAQRWSDCSTQVRWIKLINLAVQHGADINIKFPLYFGETPYVDALTWFCCTGTRNRLPSDDDLETILCELKTALPKLKDSNGTIVRWLQFHWIRENDLVRNLSLTGLEGSRDWRGNVASMCLVEMNFTAALRLYCQSVGASKSQVEELLEGRSAPKCMLLGLRCNIGIQVPAEEMRSPSSRSDLDRFYAQLDKHASLSPPYLHEDGSSSIVSQSAEIARVDHETVELLQDIFMRGMQTTYEDLMASTGFISSESVNTSDIPFLSPFEKCKLDTSKLMRRD